MDRFNEIISNLNYDLLEKGDFEQTKCETTDNKDFVERERCSDCKVYMIELEDGDLLCNCCGMTIEVTKEYHTFYPPGMHNIPNEETSNDIKHQRLTRDILAIVSHDIPKQVVCAAVTQYIKINDSTKDKIIFRGDVLSSIIACLISHFLKVINIIKTDKELAAMFKIKTGDLSSARTKVQKFIESGKIVIPSVKFDETEMFIKNMFTKLNISVHHFLLASQLFTAIDDSVMFNNTKDKLQVLKDHKPTTKVTSLIIILNRILNLNIDNSDIIAIYSRSIPTINGYLSTVSGVLHFSRITNVCKKYNLVLTQTHVSKVKL
jgi:hypothetical protein